MLYTTLIKHTQVYQEAREEGLEEGRELQTVNLIARMSEETVWAGII